MQCFLEIELFLIFILFYCASDLPIVISLILSTFIIIYLS